MEKLIRTLSKSNYEQSLSKALKKKASQEDLELLKEVAFQSSNCVENRLYQISSIAKAFQAACSDSGETGIFDLQTDGFNFGFWLQEETELLMLLNRFIDDSNYCRSENG